MKKVNYWLQGIFFFIIVVALNSGLDYLLGHNIDWIRKIVSGFFSSILCVVFLIIYIKYIKKK